jgi:hypothetical protein
MHRPQHSKPHPTLRSCAHRAVAVARRPQVCQPCGRPRDVRQGRQGGATMRPQGLPRRPQATAMGSCRRSQAARARSPAGKAAERPGCHPAVAVPAWPDRVRTRAASFPAALPPCPAGSASPVTATLPVSSERGGPAAIRGRMPGESPCEAVPLSTRRRQTGQAASCFLWCSEVLCQWVHRVRRVSV